MYPLSRARNKHQVSADDHPDRWVVDAVTAHIRHFRPWFIILENVVGFCEHQNAFGELKQALKASDYLIKVMRLDAQTFVPMERDRIFFLGVHSSVPGGAQAALDRTMAFIFNVLDSDIEVQRVAELIHRPTDAEVIESEVMADDSPRRR